MNAPRPPNNLTTKPPNHPATKPTSAAPADSITAPLAGTFYRRPAAGKPDYAKEGDVVEAGTVICSVEAMKLMNDIAAPRKCRIVKFLAEHDAAVVKGQALVSIE